MKESWKDIKDYEGIYQVDTHSNIRRKKNEKIFNLHN